ncbi:hypothetical protein [Pseudomonas aeruginosa]
MFIPFRKESIQMIGRDDRPTLIVDLESLGVAHAGSGRGDSAR